MTKFCNGIVDTKQNDLTFTLILRSETIQHLCKKQTKKRFTLPLKVLAHWVRNFRMRFSVFSYSSSFPIKMHAMDAKRQKIEPDPKNVMMDESFRGNV